jgi:riboflavin biosynthesis pyrimidine reductase
VSEIPAEPRIRRLLPEPAATSALTGAFAFPDGDGGSPNGRAWVRAVFVSSVDGAATVSGRAGGLGNETDRQLFALNRALADVILVGAGTARIEGYGPAEDDPQWRALREGRSATAPIAVVSGSLDLDFSSPLFASAPDDAETMIFTCAEASAPARSQASEVAEVVVAGEDRVDMTRVVAALRDKGMSRIICEGGPTLFADLLAAGQVDELCLTRSPLLVGGSSPAIVRGEEFEVPIDVELVSLHAGDDGCLYLLYRLSLD